MQTIINFSSKKTFSIKVLFLSIFFLTKNLPIFSQVAGIVDGSFAGIWVQSKKDTFLIKSEKQPNEGTSFQLLPDGTMKFKMQNSFHTGTWWSMNPDHFSMELTDTIGKIQYIWRFIYLDEVKNRIILVDYEEEKDYTANFVGIWKEVKEVNSEKIRWVKVDKLNPNEAGLIVSKYGEVLRQLIIKDKKKTKIETCSADILSTKENYFDFQYFSIEMNINLAEGFELSKDKIIPTLSRTRMDKF